eukprot:1148348_1
MLQVAPKQQDHHKSLEGGHFIHLPSTAGSTPLDYGQRNPSTDFKQVECAIANHIKARLSLSRTTPFKYSVKLKYILPQSVIDKHQIPLKIQTYDQIVSSLVDNKDELSTPRDELLYKSIAIEIRTASAPEVIQIYSTTLGLYTLVNDVNKYHLDCDVIISNSQKLIKLKQIDKDKYDTLTKDLKLSVQHFEKTYRAQCNVLNTDTPSNIQETNKQVIATSIANENVCINHKKRRQNFDSMTMYPPSKVHITEDAQSKPIQPLSSLHLNHHINNTFGQTRNQTPRNRHGVSVCSSDEYMYNGNQNSNNAKEELCALKDEREILLISKPQTTNSRKRKRQSNRRNKTFDIDSPFLHCANNI